MRINYSGVESCCVDLEGCLKRIKEIHDDCEAQIKKIKSGSVWMGPASEGFVARGQKTINTCRIMERSLQNMILYIRRCANNYKKVDDDAMNIINQYKF